MTDNRADLKHFSRTERFLPPDLHHIDFTLQSSGETNGQPLYMKNSEDVEKKLFSKQTAIKFGSIFSKNSFKLENVWSNVGSQTKQMYLWTFIAIV